MPSKGERITRQLTVLKVSGEPRTFGDNGKAWTVTVDEDLPSNVIDIEVLSERGKDALAELKGKTAEIGLEYGNEYQGKWHLRVVKAGSWEKGQGGGGGGGGRFTPREFPPDAIGRTIAESSIQAAAEVYAGLGDGADADQIIRLGDIIYSWVVIKGEEYAKEAAKPKDSTKMKRLHALGAELGYDHEGLREVLGLKKRGIESFADGGPDRQVHRLAGEGEAACR
jgi:hypothetical protein